MPVLLLAFPPPLRSFSTTLSPNLPDPIPDEGDHYKPFSEIYRHLMTEHHMPSKKETQVASSNSTGSCPMTAQYAKYRVTCTECFKPRVIYGEKLTNSEVNDYKRNLEDRGHRVHMRVTNLAMWCRF